MVDERNYKDVVIHWKDSRLRGLLAEHLTATDRALSVAHWAAPLAPSAAGELHVFPMQRASLKVHLPWKLCAMRVSIHFGLQAAFPGASEALPIFSCKPFHPSLHLFRNKMAGTDQHSISSAGGWDLSIMASNDERFLCIRNFRRIAN